jgi:chorismate dehydratase
LLTIGQIEFINMLPLAWDGTPPFPLTIKTGPPTAINRLILESEIDAAVISLTCYLDNRDLLIRLGNLGIFSHGPVMSVMLFSRVNLSKESENGLLRLYETSQSATSVELNRIILRKMYGIGIVTVPSIKDAEAALMIGNQALLERSKGRWDHQYDLGQEWQRLTGLPAVFAVLAASRKTWPEKQSELHQFQDFLSKTYLKNKKDKAALVAKAGRVIDLEEETLYRYFQCLDYEIGPEEEKSIALFDHLRQKYQG